MIELVEHTGELEMRIVAPTREALYLMDVDGFVATGVEVEHLEGSRLDGVFVGARDPRLRPLVKAATYHGLVVRRVEDGWEGRVVLDV